MSERELKKTVDALIKQEALPKDYARTVEQTILPLVDHIVDLRRQAGDTVVVGIHGAQGTGKSTLTLFLKEILSTHRLCPTANFSLDDIYLTRAERRELADTVHPLFITRGVPGTHDVELGREVIETLRSVGVNDRTPIPAFDKSIDDRVPPNDWPVFQGPASVILLEGWCLGASPEPEEALERPINRLEADEDAQGVWRTYVNDCLKGSYRQLFEQIDSLVMLKAPSMESVQEWRTLQEHKLAARIQGAPKKSAAISVAQGLCIMSDEEVRRFIMHYERVTRSCLKEMPDRADVLIEVAEDHSLGLPRFRLT
ncbi:hypothetical protein QQF73_15450 [Marinobacter sp. M216]|uniref:Kinase n=1 Tax=Marinobacter albus TaxID=3030833 RepID=A0ABT7HF80_9GAMM|nr:MULTISPECIES: hypothetical protein [unclassified Marinobacter]MBW7472479.1 hypothetical protein [Marinobacter sp. F4218]MDK9559029.1 hypothetical protein [Marinobacter sp. M216]